MASSMRRAEIVGGGMAGLTLATALGRRGWQVTLREAAPALRGYGGGLYMSADGLAAAREVGIGDRLEAASFAPRAFETFVDGELRGRDVNTGTYRTALRGTLHGLLLESAVEAGVTLLPSARVMRVDPEGRIGLADGSTAEADLVVIAEGTGSSLPPLLGLHPRRRLFPEGLVRVLLDRSDLPGEVWENARDFWNFRHRRLRILYSPCSPTHCYLVMMAPAEEPGTDGLPVRPEVWAPSFPELVPLLERIGGEGRFDRYGSIRMARWSAGRAAVIGDAAHAMPSSIGRGANIAMRSAVTLARALEAGVEAGLAAWEAEMRPVVEDTQRLAESIIEERARAALGEGPIVRRGTASAPAERIEEEQA